MDRRTGQKSWVNSKVFNNRIATLPPHTGNEYKYKNHKIPADDRTAVWMDG